MYVFSVHEKQKTIFVNEKLRDLASHNNNNKHTLKVKEEEEEYN